MRSLLLVAVIAASAFIAGGLATAATGWKVFASGADTGAYSTFASVNADVLGAHALALRATKKAKVSWFINCEGETAQAAPGEVVVADVAHAVKCSLDGSAVSDGGGKMTVQLLRG